MRLESITPLILTYNEAPNIERVLRKLDWASQIVVVDSGSKDATLEILSADRRVTVLTRTFDSFAGQCNFGLTQIRTDWVLSLDADYVCSDALITEIRSIADNPSASGYRVPFRYCIDGSPLRGSLYPPRTVLYRRNSARYEDDGHAHHVVIDGAVANLSAVIFHDDRKPLTAWLAAQDRYVAREVDKLMTSPASELTRADRLRKALWIAPLVTPFYCLVAKGLIFDGRRGLVYSLQRGYAEVLLALRLHAAKSSVALARNEQSPTESG